MKPFGSGISGRGTLWPESYFLCWWPSSSSKPSGSRNQKSWITSVCVVSEPFKKTTKQPFILWKIHRCGMVMTKGNITSNACITSLCSMGMFLPHYAEHSEALGPLQFHITKERHRVLWNDYTFLLRGELPSLCDEKSLLDVFWALWKAIYEKSDESTLPERRL